MFHCRLFCYAKTVFQSIYLVTLSYLSDVYLGVGCTSRLEVVPVIHMYYSFQIKEVVYYDPFGL